MGTSLLLRFHGAAIRLDARPSHLRERGKQARRRAPLRVHRWVDGGPIWTAPHHDARNPVGGSSAHRAGRNFKPRALLFLLPLQRSRLRVRRTLTDTGAAVAMVRQIAWEGNGRRVSGNRGRRRTSSMDLSCPGATFWMAYRSPHPRRSDYRNRASSRVRFATISSANRSSTRPFIGGKKRVPELSFLLADPGQYGFHWSGNRNPVQSETLLEPGSTLFAGGSDECALAGAGIQHRGPSADGMVSRSLFQEMRHVGDLPSHRHCHSGSIFRTNTISTLCLCHCVRHRIGWGLHDHPLDDGGDFRRASVGPANGHTARRRGNCRSLITLVDRTFARPQR